MSQNAIPVLYDLFLAFNRRLTAILRELKPPVLLSESHVLGEIKQQRITNSTHLIQTLHLEKTKVSRIIASFLERGWIEVQVSHTDKRVKYFSITADGEAVMNNDNSVRNEQVSRCVAPLTDRERIDFTEYLKYMADHFGAAQVTPLPHDLPIKNEIRRLTRVLGYLGDNLLELGMSVSDCQVIHLVHRDQNSVSMAVLKDLLPYEVSTLSRLISDLQSRGLAKKVPLTFDRRHVQVSLTGKGEDRALSHIRRGGQRLLDGIAPLGEAATRQLILLFEKFLVHQVAAPASASGALIRTLRREDERSAARIFLIEQAVRTNSHQYLRESIISHLGITAALYADSTIKGVCEAQKTRGEWTICHCAVAPELSERMSVLELILTAVEKCFEQAAVQQILISDSGPAEALLADGELCLIREGKPVVRRTDIARMRALLPALPARVAS